MYHLVASVEDYVKEYYARWTLEHSTMLGQVGKNSIYLYADFFFVRENIFIPRIFIHPP